MQGRSSILFVDCAAHFRSIIINYNSLWFFVNQHTPVIAWRLWTWKLNRENSIYSATHCAMALPTLIIKLLFACTTLSTAIGGIGAVHFSVIVSHTPATLNTSGVVSAVDRALQIINSDPTLLPRNQLQRSLLATQVLTVLRGCPLYYTVLIVL